MAACIARIKQPSCEASKPTIAALQGVFKWITIIKARVYKPWNRHAEARLLEPLYPSSHVSLRHVFRPGMSSAGRGS